MTSIRLDAFGNETVEQAFAVVMLWKGKRKSNGRTDMQTHSVSFHKRMQFLERLLSSAAHGGMCQPARVTVDWFLVSPTLTQSSSEMLLEPAKLQVIGTPVVVLGVKVQLEKDLQKLTNVSLENIGNTLENSLSRPILALPAHCWSKPFIPNHPVPPCFL